MVRILNVSSVEQIRRRRSARLKGMAFLCVEDDKRNKVNVGVCPWVSCIGLYLCIRH